MPTPKEGENELPPRGALKASTLFDMTDRVCVVTGGGSGIGAMIAAGFVENGAKVYIVSRKDISPFAAQLTKRGPGVCKALAADVSSQESTDAFIKQMTQLEPKGVDCLVNNAGTNWSEPLSKFSMKGWDKVYDLNVKAVFYLTQQMVPLLEKKASKSLPSSVINIASVDGIRIPTEHPTYAYSSGKAAVIHLTKHMAAHLSAKHITVNVISPGLFPSRMTRGMIDNVGEELLIDGIPMDRPGQVEDMAANCLLLASKAGSWMTGVNIVLDGGFTLHANKDLARASL